MKAILPMLLVAKSEKSLLRQKKIEGSDNVSFTEYLENYFNN